MINRLLILCLIALSSPAFAKSNLTTSLPDSDELAQIVDETATELADGNISTGTTSVGSAKLVLPLPKTSAEKKALVKALFAERFKDHTEEALPKDAKVTLKVSLYTPSSKKAVAKALAEGNAYDPSDKETASELSATVASVLSKLGVDSKSVLGSAKTRLKSDSSGEFRNIYYFVYVNPSSQKIVEFFIIEGDM